MNKFTKFLKAAAFILVFALLFNVVSGALVYPGDYRNYQWVGEFYKAEKNSLDAVYVGSSAVYAFWSPALAWKEHGIAVWNYTTGRQPLLAAKYIIEDCRKTQKDALYIVNINRVSADYNKASIHYLLDYMPFSLNKLKLTKALCDGLDIKGDGSLEYYFPLEIYHSRWNSLNIQDFTYGPDGTKSSANYYSFLQKSVTDTSHTVASTDGVTEFDGMYLDALNDLLDYCEKNEVRVLFTVNPQLSDVGDRYGDVAYAKSIIEKRGFDVVDYWADSESTGLEIPKDFYNDRHTNIHGAIKMTNLFSNYLVENYDFEDKRGKEGYEDWDEAFDNYYNDVIGSFVLPIEFETENRDYTLSAVTGVSGSYNKTENTVSFTGVDGADGYKVFRKTINNKKVTQSNYRELLTLESGETTFSDSEFNDTRDGTYSFNYIIVPYKTVDGVQKYGSFSYFGTTIKVG